MNRGEVKPSFDSEKMEVLTFYLQKQNSTTVQKKMDEALRLFYEQTVPEPLWEYLDAKTMPVPGIRLVPARPRPPHQNRPPKLEEVRMALQPQEAEDHIAVQPALE